MKKTVSFAVAILFVSLALAQDDLINKLKNNKSENSPYQFTITKNVECTSIKNQASSGTCWSYSGISFLESEMIRMGKKPMDLSEIFIVRNAYVERAKQYILWSGNTGWGDGAELHDVLQMFKKYGTVPQEVYGGLQYGATKNDFDEMQNILKAILEATIKNPNGKISPAATIAFQSTLDAFLGKAPEEFIYQGKKYTPKSFSDEVIGINADDYIELSNYPDYTYYTQFVLPMPDNWSHSQAYNVKMEEITQIIDNALNNGFSVAWSTDVSEPYFSWKNGVAFVPDMNLNEITKETKLFDKILPEKSITETLRNEALNNLSTTDDHGMHIIGFAKDQNGKEYYIVKNSWGESNDYQGFLYVTKAFVQYKSTSIVVHKNAITQEIKKKLKI